MHVENITTNYAREYEPNGSPIIVNAWREETIASKQSITLEVLPGAIEYVISLWCSLDCLPFQDIIIDLPMKSEIG